MPIRSAVGPRDAEREVLTRGSAGRPSDRSGERIRDVVSAFSGTLVDASCGSGEYTSVALGSRGRPI